jgi:hypothetical protein
VFEDGCEGAVDGFVAEQGFLEGALGVAGGLGGGQIADRPCDLGELEAVDRRDVPRSELRHSMEPDAGVVAWIATGDRYVNVCAFDLG